jgi:hypothetical protein
VNGEPWQVSLSGNTRIPICMMNVGGVSAETLKDSQRTGQPMPSLHSPFWAPAPEPTIKAGVTAMTAAALELLGKPAK